MRGFSWHGTVSVWENTAPIPLYEINHKLFQEFILSEQLKLIYQEGNEKTQRDLQDLHHYLPLRVCCGTLCHCWQHNNLDRSPFASSWNQQLLALTIPDTCNAFSVVLALSHPPVLLFVVAFLFILWIVIRPLSYWKGEMDSLGATGMAEMV